MTTCTRHGIELDRVATCPRCMLEADLPVAVLGGCELQDEIGHGGMGSVYRAKHLRLGRTVAIKLLDEDLAAQDGFKTRFEREARALAMLNHPNIVGVHDVGHEDGQSFIVMEFVDGQPLSRLMPLPLDRAVGVAAEVCDALAYAHRQGVVHRDIKPENILVTREGRVKVGDFGIARIVRPDGRGWTATSSAEVLGTPQYMAPEALAGAPPDARMDIYSVGVLLYEMATGHPPVGNFEPPPAAIDAVVRRALAPNPDRRYQTVDELKRDLESPGASVDELPADEETWVKAVATLQSISTAVAIWAFVKSVTPRRIEPGEITPLVMIERTTLPDGTIWSRARFEMWWTIAALATFAVAISAYGFLRRHWRLAGLERAEPDRPVREARWVFLMGLVACATWGLRVVLESRGLQVKEYFEILGAFEEILMLFFFWVTTLKAWRLARPLRREPAMWTGFALALLPPAFTLVQQLGTWQK